MAISLTPLVPVISVCVDGCVLKAAKGFPEPLSEPYVLDPESGYPTPEVRLGNLKTCYDAAIHLLAYLAGLCQACLELLLLR